MGLCVEEVTLCVGRAVVVSVCRLVQAPVTEPPFFTTSTSTPSPGSTWSTREDPWRNQVIRQGFGVGVRAGNAMPCLSASDDENCAASWPAATIGIVASTRNAASKTRSRLEMYLPRGFPVVTRVELPEPHRFTAMGAQNNPGSGQSVRFRKASGVKVGEGKTTGLSLCNYDPGRSTGTIRSRSFSYLRNWTSAVKRLESEGVLVIEHKPKTVIVADLKAARGNRRRIGKSARTPIGVLGSQGSRVEARQMSICGMKWCRRSRRVYVGIRWI